MQPIQVRFSKKLLDEIDVLVEKGYYKDRSGVIRDMVRHGVLKDSETQIEDLEGVRKARELDTKVQKLESKVDSLIKAFQEHTKRSLPEWAKER